MPIKAAKKGRWRIFGDTLQNVQQSCLITSLPQEIREMIYGYCISKYDQIDFIIAHRRLLLDHDYPSNYDALAREERWARVIKRLMHQAKPSALLLTCKFFLDEMITFWFKSLHIVVEYNSAHMKLLVDLLHIAQVLAPGHATTFTLKLGDKNIHNQTVFKSQELKAIMRWCHILQHAEGRHMTRLIQGNPALPPTRRFQLLEEALRIAVSHRVSRPTSSKFSKLTDEEKEEYLRKARDTNWTACKTDLQALLIRSGYQFLLTGMRFSSKHARR